MTLESYLTLLDWTGRQLRGGTRGVIPLALASILDRLQVSAESWLETIARFGRQFHRAVGLSDHLKVEARRLGVNRLHGLRWSARWHSRTRPVLDCLRALPSDCGNSPEARFDRGHVRTLTRAFSTEQSGRLPAWREEPPQLRASIPWARLVSEVSVSRQAMRGHHRP